MRTAKAKTVVTMRYGTMTIFVYSLYYGALLVTQHGKKASPTKLRSKKSVPEEVEWPAGTIFVSQRDKNAQKRVYLVYRGGIYPALRARRHTIRGYGKRKVTGKGSGEREEIEISATTLRGVVKRLLSYSWLSESEKKQLNDLLAYVSAILEGAKNELKKTAFKKLSTCVLLRDSLGRMNPSATSAKITAARSRLVLRLDQIGFIAPHIAAWELALEEELHRSLAILNNVFQFSKKSLDVLRSAASVSPEFAMQLPSAIGGYVKDMETIIVHPLHEAARSSAKDLKQVKYAAEVGRWDDVDEILDRVKRSMIFKFAQYLMEKTISWFDEGVYCKQEQETKFWKELEKRVEDFRKRAQEKLNDAGFKEPIWNDAFLSSLYILQSAVRHCDAKETRMAMKRISAAL